MKQKLLIVTVIIAIVILAIVTCKDDPPPPEHTHDWEWVVTAQGSATEERIETETCTCGATNGTRSVRIDREKIITLNIPVETYQTTATAKIEGTSTLSEMTAFANKLTTAIDNAFVTASIPPLQAKYKNVFDHPNAPPKIIIENNVIYVSYEVDHKLQVRFNSGYLLTASTTDLETEIDEAIEEMSAQAVQ